jgi:5-bromo-4-chloroindolyl phosphate hydrolysis protein
MKIVAKNRTCWYQFENFNQKWSAKTFWYQNTHPCAQVRLESVKNELNAARQELENLQKMTEREKSYQNASIQSLEGELSTREARFEFEMKQNKLEFDSGNAFERFIHD